MTELKKIVEVSPSYDKRHSDPKKNYGIGACVITFFLKGKKGVVQFKVSSGWYVPTARAHLSNFPESTFDRNKPVGYDLGYHSYKPMYEGQDCLTEKCRILDNKPCYYDGSGLRADEIIEDFIAGGTEWLWKELEKEYKERFDSSNQE